MDDSTVYGLIWAAMSEVTGVTRAVFGSDATSLTEGDYPALAVLPTGWTEHGQVDPESPERVLSFEVRILGRLDVGQGGGFELFRALAAITADVLDAVRGNSFGGLTVGPLSQCGAAKITRSGSIESHVLECQAGYLPLGPDSSPEIPEP